MNIAYILTQSARAYCDRPAVCLGLSTFSTYTQLQDRSAALAAALKQRNLVKGDRVLIFMGNRPEYIEILFAIWTAGCVAVPLNAKLHPNEVTYIHANCDAALAFTDRPEDVEGFSAVIAVGGPEYNAALQASADLQPAHAAQTDPAWIFYTSGTTGRPKGAILTHRNLWTICVRLRKCRRRCIRHRCLMRQGCLCYRLRSGARRMLCRKAVDSIRMKS